MHGTDVLAPGKRLGNLANAIFAGVEHHHFDVALASLTADVVNQLGVVRRRKAGARPRPIV